MSSERSVLAGLIALFLTNGIAGCLASASDGNAIMVFPVFISSMVLTGAAYGFYLMYAAKKNELHAMREIRLNELADRLAEAQLVARRVVEQTNSAASAHEQRRMIVTSVLAAAAQMNVTDTDLWQIFGHGQGTVDSLVLRDVIQEIEQQDQWPDGLRPRCRTMLKSYASLPSGWSTEEKKLFRSSLPRPT